MTSAPDRAPRLALLLKGYPRISETFILNEIRLLEQAGFRLAIISMRPPREAIRHKCVEEIQAPVFYLPEYFFKSLHIFLFHALCFAVRHPIRWAKAFAYMLGRIPGSSSKVACVKHLFQGAMLAQTFCKSQPIAHVHAHFAHSPTSVAAYVSMLTGLPFSFTAHAKDIYTQEPERLRDKLRRAAFVVTCTRHNLENLKAITPEKDIRCVYHGIDVTQFAPPAQPLPAAPPYTILTVARFVDKKGLPTILQALALLKSQGLEFRYLLVGDGPRKQDILGEISALGLQDEVELLGTQPHEKVVQLFRQAHCFTLGCNIAKDGDRDGIPNVIAEAMAMGVPVAATEVSAIPELVVHGETGLLCACHDAEAMAASIRRLCTDKSFRTRCIPAARKRVEAVFDNTICIQDLAAIYRTAGDVVGEPVAPASPSCSPYPMSASPAEKPAADTATA